MNTTGCLPVAVARSISSAWWSVITGAVSSAVMVDALLRMVGGQPRRRRVGGGGTTLGRPARAGQAWNGGVDRRSSPSGRAVPAHLQRPRAGRRDGPPRVV